MTREELHALVDAHYDKLTGLQSEKTFYAYEEGFVKVWTELGGQVMQASLKQGTSTDKRKKNCCQTRFGRLELSKTHRYKAKTNGFFISPYLQNLMALAGVSDVYSKSNDLLNAFLGINISESQLYRVTDYLGNAVADDVMAEIEHPKLNNTERVYASMDGSMIQMDQGWQEIKLGRIFREGCRLENGIKEQGNIRYKLDESSYSGHLGSYTHFIPKFEASLGTYKDCEDRLVFITDGAQWIHNYLTNRFPNAIHILDYYHAVEHLTDFANSHFMDITRREKWVKAQKSELLDGSVQNVLNNIAKLRNVSNNVKKERTKLVEYYKNNVVRMNYKSFRSQGLMIGNGPMEAAHRTVIQTRMKRSGQRWTPKGAQSMLNLRVLRESSRWNCVTQALMQAA